MIKNLFRILIVIFLLIAVLVFARNSIAKVTIEWGTEQAIGLSLRMGQFDINLPKTFIGIQDLRLFNPRGYPDKVMMALPEIFVDYDLLALTEGKIHLEELRLHLKEFVVVKNQNGQLNLDSLKAVKTRKKEGATGKKPRGKLIRIQVDRLDLQIEKVVFKDYYHNGLPSVNPEIKEYKINLSERYENITDMNALVSLIVVKALTNTTIANLTNFDIGILSGPVSGILGSSTKIAAYAGSKAGGVLKEAAGETGVTEELEGAAKKGTQAVKSLFGELKKSLE